MAVIAVGVPGWPVPSTSWDLWPFIGIALTLLLARNPLRVRVWPWAVAIALLVGPCFAFAVHSWGVVPVLAFTVSAYGLLVAVARTAGREGSVPPV